MTLEPRTLRQPIATAAARAQAGESAPGPDAAPSVQAAPPAWPAPPAPRWRWLGFFRLPRRLSRQVLSVSAALADRLGRLPGWLGAGVVLGAGPLYVDYLLGRSLHQLALPFLIFPLLLAAVARDALGRGLAFLGTLLVAHCALAVALSAHDPAGMAVVLPGGAAYWDQSERWIRGFYNPEYDPASWLPAQLQLLGAFCLYGYLSLGMAPLWQGFHEAGLMNYYVGRLMAESEDPLLALVLGWHPWSWCRGLGYLILTFEVSSLALEHLTGTRLSSLRRRLGRWGAGLAFLALDIGIKYASMGTVREMLAANLP
jgi:hypothetical protein